MSAAVEVDLGHHGDAEVVPGLVDLAVNVRHAERGDTFPGLGGDWLRVAVRDRRTTDVLDHHLREVLT